MLLKKPITQHVELSVVLGAIVAIVFFSVSTQGRWLDSLPSVLAVTAQIGILTIGQALLMTSGEVDLSVGSVFAFVGLIFVMIMDLGVAVFPSMLLALAAALLIGMTNGYLTTRFRVPSMIVTLGALFVFRGIAYILTEGYSLSIPRPFRKDPIVEFFDDRTMGIANTFFVLLFLTLVFAFVLARTRFGNHVLAVGGDPAAASANGISPSRVKMTAFMLCSLLAGIAGILVTCQEGAVYSTSGKLLELETIAAAVMGGCTLRGGIGSIWGPVLGVFVLSSLKGGLMLMGAPTYWYISFVGLILIGFLIAAKLLSGGFAQTR